jgi:hypothetical protein
MKKFEEIAFDYVLCRKQVEHFRAWLASNEELSERDDVLPFFRGRSHTAVLFGMFNLSILADALEDAGCTHPDILGHLRETGPTCGGAGRSTCVLGRG